VRHAENGFYTGRMPLPNNCPRSVDLGEAVTNKNTNDTFLDRGKGSTGGSRDRKSTGEEVYDEKGEGKGKGVGVT